MVEPAGSVLIREVPLVQSVLYREVQLYTILYILTYHMLYNEIAGFPSNMCCYLNDASQSVL